VDFETLDDVKVGELVVIPKGSVAMATITEAVPKRRIARGGKLSMNIALRGIQDVKGGGHTGAMTGAMVATGIVFFPAAPLFLFMHGKDITIPKGHEVTVYTNTDYDLSKIRAAATTTGPTPPAGASKVLSGSPLSNPDIVRLKEVGLSDQLIIDKIESSPANYKLDTDDMIELKKAGLSDGVIGAMLGASKRQSAPVAPLVDR
jgi:hypothetical protein